MKKGMVVFSVTEKMVEEWLGTTNQIKEAIKVIQEIANGQYTIDELNEDIIRYYEGNWEYKEEK
tara:strand:- start:309 stop:500 length:192 start_codon:yes stop_codon:yes gene_type:complete